MSNPNAKGLTMSTDTPVILPSPLLLAMVEHRIKAYSSGSALGYLSYEEFQALHLIQRMAEEHHLLKVGPA